MEKFKEILLYIWQLPQNLLGLFLILCYNKNIRQYHKLNGRIFYSTPDMPSGISLGNYIIMRYDEYGEGMKHEYGHSIDSRRFGWLYLIIIGLPSIICNIYDRMFHKKWKYSDACEWYYNLPWEKSADKNGGVNREAYIEKLRKYGY